MEMRLETRAQNMVSETASVFWSRDALMSPLPGVRLEYLPPYLPNLNPIEEAFSKIKSHLQCHGCPSTYNLVVSTDIITPDDAAGYFQHAGIHNITVYCSTKNMIQILI